MRGFGAAGSNTIERFFEYSLLGMLASGYLAIAGSGYLARLPVIVTGLALIVRALMVAGAVRLHVPAPVATVLTLAYIGFYPIDYFYLSRSFLPATVHLILFLAVTKILTACTNRDYFYVKAIALVELLAACLLSSSSNFFLFLGFFLLFTVAALASDEIRKSAENSRGARVVSARFQAIKLGFFVACVSSGILVITAGLFFLLPRTARAALQHLVPARYHLAGFSNQVDLGEIGEIKQQDTPVMHVQAQGGARLSSALKWRGATLGSFDGKRWFNPPGMQQLVTVDKRGLYILASPEERRREVPRLTYIVHLNEIAGDALFFAGKPEFLWIETPYLVRTSPGAYRRQSGSAGAAVYQARSFQEATNGPQDNDADLTPSLRDLYLRVPPLDPRIPALAKAAAGRTLDPLIQARNIKNYLRDAYAYTLDLPVTEPRDPLAYFLFERRKGHCEYFASAMAIMLRTLRIPTRVATGFQGGMYNPIAGQQLIRASDAHSWVEAWIPGTGWTTFDPTPPDLTSHPETLWSQISLYLDAADLFWQEWVINYSLDHQLVLASRMEDSSRRLHVGWPDSVSSWASKYASALVSAGSRYGLALLIAALIAGMSWSFGPDSWKTWRARIRLSKARRGQATRSDATLLYQRMLRLLRKRGVEKPAWLTPVEFAQMLREPAVADVARELTAAYNEVRFGGRSDRAARIVELLGKLE